MDNVQISIRIEQICDELKNLRVQIEDFIKRKPIGSAILEYRKQMAIELATLKAANEPVTTRKETAQTHCAEHEADLENAKIEWRGRLACLEAAEKEGNMWQSLNKTQTERFSEER